MCGAEYSRLGFLLPFGTSQRLPQAAACLLSLFPALTTVQVHPVRSQGVGHHSGLVQNPGHGYLQKSFTHLWVPWEIGVGGDFPASVCGYLLLLPRLIASTTLEGGIGFAGITSLLPFPFHPNTPEQKIQVWRGSRGTLRHHFWEWTF